MTANGQLNTQSQLTSVQGAIQLANDAAADYLAMHRAGMPGSIATPAGGYRSTQLQKLMHDEPREFNLTPGIVLAPVGQSPHGDGEYVDIVPAAAVAWVEVHGAAFGFTRRASNDPNCFKHTGGTHTSTASTGTTIVARPPTGKAAPMRLTPQDDTSTYWLLNEQTGEGRPITGPTAAAIQTNAETVDRVLNGKPARSDLQFYAGLLATKPVKYQ
jgi:hypothetical protein